MKNIKNVKNIKFNTRIKAIIAGMLLVGSFKLCDHNKGVIVDPVPPASYTQTSSLSQIAYADEMEERVDLYGTEYATCQHAIEGFLIRDTKLYDAHGTFIRSLNLGE